MENQLFLFTGGNTFLLREELKRWKEAFLLKHGEANLQVLDGGEDLRIPALLDEVKVAPFLSDKRLVIVDGIPATWEKSDLETLKRNIHPGTVLAFVEAEPDRRKSTTKFLFREATVKSFMPLAKKELMRWVGAFASEHGAELTPDVAERLIAFAGTNQWHLRNELLKLISFCSVSGTVGEKFQISNSKSQISPCPIACTDIDRICLPGGKQTVWRLSDLIGRGDATGAVTFVSKLRQQGEDAMRLWTLFLWIVNNLALLWCFRQEKNMPIGQLAGFAGVPFPAAQSLLPLVEKLSKEQLLSIIVRAVAADEAQKTGEIRSSAEEPVEIVALLERELMRLA